MIRQLAEVLRDLRPLADARVRAKKMEARSWDQREGGGLEKRMAALVKLDGEDVEKETKLFG